MRCRNVSPNSLAEIRPKSVETNRLTPETENQKQKMETVLAKYKNE